jgi:hypothetical protein
MDAATLQARINSGYGKAAQRVGYPFTVYRHTVLAGPVLVPASRNKTSLSGGRRLSLMFQR